MGIRGGGSDPAFGVSTEAVVGHVAGQIEAIILRVDGEIDMATAPLLAGAIAKAFQAAPGVILDLSRVSYLDLSGVHIFERIAEGHPTRFVIVGTRPQVRRVIEVLNLRSTLPFVASIQAAREYLRPQ